MEYGATMKQINCIRYFWSLLQADSGHMCFGLECPFNTCLLVNFCQPVNIQISHDPSLQQSRLNRYDGSKLTGSLPCESPPHFIILSPTN